MRLGLIMMLAAVGLAGCSAGLEASFDDTEDFIDMTPPPSNCSAGTGADPCPSDSSGSPEGGPCLDSSGCLDGNACVAPFEDGQVGDFTCTAQCIDLGDETSWCLDASACCDSTATCTSRGLCVPGGSLDGTTGGSGSDSGSVSDSGSDTAGSGSDSGSGSDTGAATGTTGMR